MVYKGYYGSVEFSDDDNIFFGRLINVNDRITYEGDSVNSLRKDFEESVDEYLETCSQIGKEPEKTYKGSFNIRITPSLHKQLAIYSATEGKTLNTIVAEAIQHYVDK
jgi:predicted HicB family RNase H-like nuclease